MDASINLDTGTWFFVSGRQFPYKIIDVDLADNIVIFQGAETHNVLFYSIYSVLNVFIKLSNNKEKYLGCIPIVYSKYSFYGFL